MVNRLNMKELRDALNKLPEDYLELTSIAPDTCTDSPDGDITLVTLYDDEKWTEDKVAEFASKSKEIDLIIKRFVNLINKDAEMLNLDPNNTEYSEDYGLEPDW